MYKFALVAVMFVTLPAWSGEFSKAGSIRFGNVIDSLEWAVQGYDYGDSKIEVWYRPADSCFPSDADAVGLVRQWIDRDVQDHRIDGIELFCQRDQQGAVVVFADIKVEGGIPVRLYAYRKTTDGCELGTRLFDMPGGSPTAEGFQLHFVVLDGAVVRLVRLQEFPESPGPLDMGSSKGALLTVVTLDGHQLAPYGFAVFEGYRVDEDNGTTYLFLGSPMSVEYPDLESLRIGEELSEISHAMPSSRMSGEMVGERATRQLEGVEDMRSRFEQRVRALHGVELYKSDFVDRYVRELKRRTSVPGPTISAGSPESPEMAP
jgi:hypothetical protein